MYRATSVRAASRLRWVPTKNIGDGDEGEYNEDRHSDLFHHHFIDGHQRGLAAHHRILIVGHLQKQWIRVHTLLMCGLICLVSALAQGSESRPNVVLILADDLGYGDLSCYGQTAYQTPAIDRLASEGVRATDFYVPVPYCAPSRAALLTGRFPLRNGMTRNPHPGIHDERGLRLEEITLGEVFQQAGYATICIGKWHLGHTEKFHPSRQGFDEYYGILYSNDMRPVQIIENMDLLIYLLKMNI